MCSHCILPIPSIVIFPPLFSILNLLLVTTAETNGLFFTNISVASYIVQRMFCYKEYTLAKRMDRSSDRKIFHPLTISAAIIGGLIFLPIGIFFYVQHYFIIEPLPEGSKVPFAVLATINGQRVSTDSLLTQKGIFVFFSPSCQHCKHLLVSLQTLYRQSEENVHIYAISSGAMAETHSFMGKNNLSIPVLLDSTGKVWELYRVRTVPALFIIDTDKGLKYFTAGEIGKERLTELMERYYRPKRRDEPILK